MISNMLGDFIIGAAGGLVIFVSLVGVAQVLDNVFHYTDKTLEVMEIPRQARNDSEWEGRRDNPSSVTCGDTFSTREKAGGRMERRMCMNEGLKGCRTEVVSHIRDYDYEVICGAVGSEEFPKEYEIPRENTGTLKDQGKVGACVAEVIAQIAEELWRRQTGDSEEHSEGYIYGKFRDDNSTGYGLVVSQAMKCWMNGGTIPKKYYDDLYEMPDMKKIIKKFPEFDKIAEKYKISGFVSVNYANREKRDNAVKDALTKYSYGLVAVSNKYFGESHCIMLTGWNDNTGCYKFKNSWGESYRDGGFGEIPKDKIDYIYLPLLEDIKLPFTDVSEDAWYYKYVKNMYFNGLMKGTDSTTFEPDKPMTRAEVATILYRILKLTDERFDILNKVLEEKKV